MFWLGWSQKKGTERVEAVNRKLLHNIFETSSRVVRGGGIFLLARLSFEWEERSKVKLGGWVSLCYFTLLLYDVKVQFTNPLKYDVK